MFSSRLVLPAITAFLLAAIVTSHPITDDVETHQDKRIVSGSDVDPGSHPYIISLQTNDAMMCSIDPDLKFCRYTVTDSFKHICGGSVIASSWVLTAAHCVDLFVESKYHPAMRIVLGEHHLADFSTKEVYRGVEKIILHDSWTWENVTNDIALIKLSSSVNQTEHIKFATLPENDSELLDECILTGWGRNGTLHSQSILQEVYMSLISNDDCWIRFKILYIEEAFNYITSFHVSDIKRLGIKKVWDEYGADLSEKLFRSSLSYNLNSGHICVVDSTRGERSACYGDSGGPMMCGRGYNILAGVTSYGYRGCPGGAPNVYTRVSAYIGWIQEQTASLSEHYDDP